MLRFLMRKKELTLGSLMLAVLFAGVKFYMQEQKVQAEKERVRQEEVRQAEAVRVENARQIKGTKIRIVHVYHYRGPGKFEVKGGERLVAVQAMFESYSPLTNPFEIELADTDTGINLHTPPVIAGMTADGRGFVPPAQWPPPSAPFQCLMIYPVSVVSKNFRLLYRGQPLTQRPAKLDEMYPLPVTPGNTDLIYNIEQANRQVLGK